MRTTSIITLAAAAAVLMMLSPAPEVQAAETMKPEQCLMCHGGSFDALREQTKNWKDEFGSPVQPHQYLDPNAANPHAGAKVVPECTGCHQAHPIPVPKGLTVDVLRVPSHGEFPKVQRCRLPRKIM